MPAVSRAVALAVASLAIAGCGNNADPERSSRRATPPDQVVQQFLAAKRAADGNRMCALYSATYREELRDDPDNERHLSCERLSESYARAFRDDDNRLRRVEISGDAAIATVSCEDPSASDCSLPLVREDGRWRIAGSLSPND